MELSLSIDDVVRLLVKIRRPDVVDGAKIIGSGENRIEIMSKVARKAWNPHRKKTRKCPFWRCLATCLNLFADGHREKSINIGPMR